MSSNSKHEELGNIFLTRHGERLDWPTILGLLHPTYMKLRKAIQEELRRTYAGYIPHTREYLLSKGKVLRKEGWADESIYYTITKEDKPAAEKQIASAIDKEKRAAERTEEIKKTLQKEKALPSDGRLSKLLPVLWDSHFAFMESIRENSRKQLS